MMFKRTDNTRSQQTGIYISLMVTKLVVRSRTPEHWKQVRRICQSRGNHNTTKSHHIQSGIGIVCKCILKQYVVSLEKSKQCTIVVFRDTDQGRQLALYF